MLSSQLPKEVECPVSHVTYAVHTKPFSESTVRVEYWQGAEILAKEWLCFDHTGYPRLKAEKWWRQRALYDGIPRTTADAVTAAQQGAARAPTGLRLETSGKHTTILNYLWEKAA